MIPTALPWSGTDRRAPDDPVDVGVLLVEVQVEVELEGRRGARRLERVPGGDRVVQGDERGIETSVVLFVRRVADTLSALSAIVFRYQRADLGGFAVRRIAGPGRVGPAVRLSIRREPRERVSRSRPPAHRT